jgi:hypothetical protein
MKECRNTKSLLIKVQLPKSKSSNPHAYLMFCDSQFLNHDSVCVGFTYCTQYHDPNVPRFWFCDECGEYYKTNIKKKPWEYALDPNEYIYIYIYIYVLRKNRRLLVNRDNQHFFSITCQTARSHVKRRGHMSNGAVKRRGHMSNGAVKRRGHMSNGAVKRRGHMSNGVVKRRGHMSNGVVTCQMSGCKK